MARPLLLCSPRLLSSNVRLAAILLVGQGAQASPESKGECDASLSSRYIIYVELSNYMR